MSDPRDLQVLRLTHFLRDVPEADLDLAAAQLAHESFAAGDEIIVQGSGPEALYFLLDGTIDLLQRDARGRERHVATLTPGDTLGEVEVVFRLPRLSSARAASACTLARWERADLSGFVGAHPPALASLRFAAASRRLASRLRFGWLGEGEIVYAAVRKHVALLYQALILPVVIAMVGLVVAGYPQWAFVALLLGMLLLAWCSWIIGRQVRAMGYSERADDLLVVSGVMFRRLVLVPYGRMQLVDVRRGPIDRAFGLATVQLHTATATSDAAISGLTPEAAAGLRDRLAALGETRSAGL